MQYWIMNWKYKMAADQQVQTQTGPSTVGRVDNPQNFTTLTWFYPSVDFHLMDELTLGLGYYNLVNSIGPNGQRRNPFWSPDAVVLFDIVANLDSIYETATKRKDDDKPAAPRPKQLARQLQNSPMFAW
jgi:hypothetical protein